MLLLVLLGQPLIIADKWRRLLVRERVPETEDVMALAVLLLVQVAPLLIICTSPLPPTWKSLLARLSPPPPPFPAPQALNPYKQTIRILPTLTVLKFDLHPLAP